MTQDRNKYYDSDKNLNVNLRFNGLLNISSVLSSLKDKDQTVKRCQKKNVR